MGYKNQNYMVEYRQRNKRTHAGWLTKVYGRMRKSAKDRGMESPTFTKNELWAWVDKNKFNNLFDIWLNSGCQKQLVPSINRIDDYKSYTLGNIELTIWSDNNKKGRGSIKTWELVHSKLGNIAKKLFSKPVAKVDLNNNIICVYPSVREAARQNNADSSTISKVCRGENLTHHKYKWTYIC